MSTSDQEVAKHDHQVAAVQAAVAKLMLATGFSAEAIFEGAVKGGAVALISAGDMTASDVGGLLETLGESFRDLDRPNLRIVS